jgi:hypothetical protein
MSLEPPIWGVVEQMLEFRLHFWVKVSRVLSVLSWPIVGALNLRHIKVQMVFILKARARLVNK